MGMTLVEKILANGAGRASVKAGEYLTVKADRVMVHDLFAPFCIGKFKEMGFEHVWRPDAIVLVNDHMVPTAYPDDPRHHAVIEQFAAEQGITRLHRCDGVCHQVMMEKGHVKPGDVVFGTDSHTCTYGAIGAFSTGIGYTEMAAIWGVGELWVRVPDSIRIEMTGQLLKGAYPKDFILRLIGDLSSSGANYQALEFCGEACHDLSISARMTICNMAVEASAKCAIIAPDEKVQEYLRNAGMTEVLDFGASRSDKDAVYRKRYSYDLSAIEPVVAVPFGVDQVQRVVETRNVVIDQAFLGSCTNGRFDDLQIAAAILKGKRIAPGVRLIVTPASRDVFSQAERSGVLKTLIEAGAIVTTPSCGMCCGRSGGIPADDEVVISSNNRNFLGRLGGGKSRVYLGSPATVAASALAGKITDPREFL